MTTDLRIDTLQGKIIGITGIIELYQGKPEIEVTATESDQRLRFSAGAVIAPTLSSVEAFIKLHLLLAAK